MYTILVSEDGSKEVLIPSTNVVNAVIIKARSGEGAE